MHAFPKKSSRKNAALSQKAASPQNTILARKTGSVKPFSSALLAGTCFASVALFTSACTHIGPAVSHNELAPTPPAPTSSPTSTAKPETQSQQESSTKKLEDYDISDPSSFQVVVNKRRPLQPIGYVPTDLIYPNLVNNNNQPLRQEAAEQLLDMLQAAKDAGAGQGVIASGYRSFDLQDRIYTKLSSQLGDAEADETTARPGYSEHQTGLAVDIDDNGGCNLSLCFERTDLGRWLRENSWKWGFILRYPADKTDVTGYSYEPWHFRYVQKEVAQQMHEQGITTLEEFFNLPAATSYSE